MSGRDDDLLRSAFAEIRVRDEEVAPSFQDVQARSPRRSSIPTLLTIGVAAALLVGAVLATHNRQTLRVPNEVLALSRWQAPTDAFLPPSITAPNVRTLGESVLDFTSLLTGDTR